MPGPSSQRKTGTPASSARGLSLSFGNLLGAALTQGLAHCHPDLGCKEEALPKGCCSANTGWLEAHRDFGMCILEALSCLCAPLCVEMEYPGEENANSPLALPASHHLYIWHRFPGSP